MADLREFGMAACKFCASHWVKIEDHFCTGRNEAMLTALRFIAAGHIESQMIARECLAELGIQ